MEAVETEQMTRRTVYVRGSVWEGAERRTAELNGPGKPRVSVSLYVEQAIVEKLERDRRAAERAQARRSA